MKKKGELQHQRELNNQAQSAIQYSGSHNDKLISSLINDKTPDNNAATPTDNRHLLPKICNAIFETITIFRLHVQIKPAK